MSTEAKLIDPPLRKARVDPPMRPDLVKSLERDFEQDKDCRDEENRREGRPVSPPLYDETEENSLIPSD